MPAILSTWNVLTNLLCMKPSIYRLINCSAKRFKELAQSTELIIGNLRSRYTFLFSMQYFLFGFLSLLFWAVLMIYPQCYQQSDIPGIIFPHSPFLC